MVLDGEKTWMDQEPGVDEQDMDEESYPRSTTPTTEEYEILEHQRTWDGKELLYGGLKPI